MQPREEVEIDHHQNGNTTTPITIPRGGAACDEKMIPLMVACQSGTEEEVWRGSKVGGNRAEGDHGNKRATMKSTTSCLVVGKKLGTIIRDHVAAFNRCI
jgi:hypothetical protein